MNKKLLLPLFGLLAVAVVGCDKENDGGSKTNIDVEPEDMEFDISELADPIEYTDTTTGQTYKMVEGSPEDGKEYFFGFYSTNKAKMYFFNGGPHHDANGEYPFYLGCDANNISTAAKIKVEYVDDTYFTMQVVAGSGSGAYKPTYYDGKYIEFYSEYNSKNHYQTTSIHAVEKEDLTSWGHFRFRYTVDDLYAYTYCAWIKNTQAEETEYTYKGFGTYGSYESIGCLDQDKIVQDGQYLARFWEVVEE